jgi:hypothetical protein
MTKLNKLTTWISSKNYVFDFSSLIGIGDIKDREAKDLYLHKCLEINFKNVTDIELSYDEIMKLVSVNKQVALFYNIYRNSYSFFVSESEKFHNTDATPDEIFVATHSYKKITSRRLQYEKEIQAIRNNANIAIKAAELQFRKDIGVEPLIVGCMYINNASFDWEDSLQLGKIDKLDQQKYRAKEREICDRYRQEIINAYREKNPEKLKEMRFKTVSEIFFNEKPTFQD